MIEIDSALNFLAILEVEFWVFSKRFLLFVGVFDCR